MATSSWHANTRIRLVPRVPAQHPDYVRFVSGGGCSSMVGRQGGRQDITLGARCTTGNCIHEVGHSVGLWHEQSREDRDTFVQIVWANIDPAMQYNFTQHVADGDDLGAYDFGSIMHYPPNAFSINGQNTIVARQALPPGVVMGQRNGLSTGDIAGVHALYPGATTVKELAKDPVTDPVTTVKEVRKDPITDFITVKEVRKDPVGRLSGTAMINQSNQIKLVLCNTGNSPAAGVKLSVTAPSGWTVTLNPETVVEVPANQEVEVTADVKPADNAIAGDYVVTFRAQPNQSASKSAEFRITVQTSTLWGAVGIALIAVAVAIVGMAVTRFGRR